MKVTVGIGDIRVCTSPQRNLPLFSSPKMYSVRVLGPRGDSIYLTVENPYVQRSLDLFDEETYIVYLQRTERPRPCWPPGIKDYLYGIQAGICNGCCLPTPFRKMERDHYIPALWGGPDTLENCQLLCLHCNRRKRDRPMWPSRELCRHKPVESSLALMYGDFG